MYILYNLEHIRLKKYCKTRKKFASIYDHDFRILNAIMNFFPQVLIDKSCASLCSHGWSCDDTFVLVMSVPNWIRGVPFDFQGGVWVFAPKFNSLFSDEYRIIFFFFWPKMRYFFCINFLLKSLICTSSQQILMYWCSI